LGWRGDEAAHSGELVFGGGDADFDAFDLADPAAFVGFGEALAEVGDDLFESAPLGWVGPEHRAADAGVECSRFSGHPIRLPVE
jgi:hypothetical protein